MAEITCSKWPSKVLLTPPLAQIWESHILCVEYDPNPSPPLLKEKSLFVIISQAVGSIVSYMYFTGRRVDTDVL